MRKLFATLTIICVLSTGAQASGSSSEWTSYFTVDWDEVTNFASNAFDDAADYVLGFFGSEPETQSKDNLPPHLASDWGKLTGSLDDALELRDRHESLPNSTWLPFTEDKASNSRKINKILDRALAVLINGEAGDMRRQAVELRAKITGLGRELDELRNKKITAPDKSYLFWEITKEKADKRIALLEDELRKSRAALTQINAKLAASLNEIGLELNASQVDILLNSVTGDELLQNAIIFDNVKLVAAKLEELARNETNSFEITRRYSGMYLVLNDLLIHTQEELIKKIDGDYKVKLKAIINEADTLQKDALRRSKQGIYSKAQREAFAANAKSNAVTIRVAELYSQLLDTQRTGTLNTLKSLRLNRDLAENTYRTVRSTDELRGLIRSGLNLFDTIGALSMPELKIFENGAMRLEFEEINRRLKK
ncbi:MAG: hypothetical protein IJT58_06645 [Synergistaceae bacterium]|nr:hypothetical protein [Synergistaceae bacterium]